MYCHILRVRAIPTLESTDSMMMEMSVHIDNQPFTVILSSEVKNSEVYSHEVAW